MRDLYHNVGVVHLLDAQDITTNDTKSSILDLQGFESAMLLVNVGTITTPDANSYITPTLQHSDTTADSGFAAVDSGDILGGFSKIDANNEDQVTQVACYIGSKRYVRVLVDISDADAGISNALVSVDGLVSKARNAPVSAPTAVAAT